ncbi:MAG: hypothetical protein NTW66_04610 [Candidatus Magasanikbacteria bacterium]|nr:hypothetical protein [Candidatus Magasanikbacteria bacterium]
MFERFRGFIQLEGKISENKKSKKEIPEAERESAGQEVVDAAVNLSEKENPIAKAVRRSRNEDASLVRDVSTKWKTVALGLALAFGLNAFAPKVMAGERRTDEPSGGDESGQTEGNYEKIVREAKARLVAPDIEMMKVAVHLTREMVKEPPYKPTYPSTGNALYPIPSDYKDYLHGTSDEARAKQETMFKLFWFNQYNKAKEMASGIIGNDLGKDALEDEGVINMVDAMAGAYANRNLPAFDSFYQQYFADMMNKLSSGEEESAPAAPDANFEGPMPSKLHVEKLEFSGDVVPAMRDFHGSMLDSVIASGEQKLNKIKNAPSDIASKNLLMAEEIARAETALNKVSERLTGDLSLEQKILVTMNPELTGAIKKLAEDTRRDKVTINGVIYNRAWIENMAGLISAYEQANNSFHASGHDKKIGEEINPNLWLKMFHQMNFAFVDGDAQKLQELVDKAKLVSAQDKLNPEYDISVERDAAQNIVKKEVLVEGRLENGSIVEPRFYGESRLDLMPAWKVQYKEKDEEEEKRTKDELSKEGLIDQSVFAHKEIHLDLGNIVFGYIGAAVDNVKHAYEQDQEKVSGPVAETINWKIVYEKGKNGENIPVGQLIEGVYEGGKISQRFLPLGENDRQNKNIVEQYTDGGKFYTLDIVAIEGAPAKKQPDKKADKKMVFSSSVQKKMVEPPGEL